MSEKKDCLFSLKRKWNNDYILFGFFIPKKTSGSVAAEDYAQCMIYQSKFKNEAWVSSKLKKHQEKMHKKHFNKSAGCFKRRQESLA